MPRKFFRQKFLLAGILFVSVAKCLGQVDVAKFASETFT